MCLLAIGPMERGNTVRRGEENISQRGRDVERNPDLSWRESSESLRMEKASALNERDPRLKIRKKTARKSVGSFEPIVAVEGAHLWGLSVVGKIGFGMDDLEGISEHQKGKMRCYGDFLSKRAWEPREQRNLYAIHKPGRISQGENFSLSQGGPIPPPIRNSGVIFSASEKGRLSPA